MKTLEEMIKLQDEGKLDILTIDKAKELRGKKIQILNFGYAHQDHTDEFVVGEILSEFEIAQRNKDGFKGFKSQAEYWESFMSPQKLEAMKESFELLNDKGGHTFAKYSADEDLDGQFHLGDIGRLVWFMVAEND